MKVGLLCPRIRGNIQENQQQILRFAKKAADEGAELVVLPEVAATGLINTHVPQNDYEIAEELMGVLTSQWCSFAQEHAIHFAAGFFERDGDSIYDSAIMFDPTGEVLLHYRRMDSGWHSTSASSIIYREGDRVVVKDTILGRTAFLICGDLWNDAILTELVMHKPNVVLYTFARSFDISSEESSDWTSELAAYKQRWISLDASVLAVNLLGDGMHETSIGGAWALERGGNIQELVPILTEGYSVIDFYP
ncbi:MAG: carbon-nitrogen hydrolase family protein [Candidatus Thorarchaeota archaeon]